MRDEEPPYIAVIYQEDGASIAGTGFTTCDGLLITCAHVVSDALGLGKQEPSEAPEGELEVEFPYTGVQRKFRATVAPGGWFPSVCGQQRRELRDIAILQPCEKTDQFPEGLDLIPGGWHGEALCLGFPAKRNGGNREVSGAVKTRKETDGWLNFEPEKLDRSADLRGMSGAPVWPKCVDIVGAMLSTHWLDDEHLLNLIPSSTLRQALKRVAPPEVFALGSKAVLTYLRDLSKIAEPLYEAKIVLVGDAAVGKTTLKERLIRNHFATPNSTRCLNMETVRYTLTGGAGVNMTLNFWDFGGQEAYQPVQQLFFSEGALYLMLWNARHDAVQSNVEAWMRLIRHRVGPDARVLVIATHANEHIPNNAVRQLCADKFGGMVIGFHDVDNKSGKGISELQEAIYRAVVELDGFGAECPKSWIDARDAIFAERSGAAHQMPIGEFRKIARAKGVASDAVGPFAAMLTKQGRIVYHGEDPNLATTVVLDPEWLMKAIAYVLTDKNTKAANGILPESRLARIWLDHGRAVAENPIRYEKEHWNYLLRMMERSDIVYRLTKEDWIVSLLVPLTKPQDLPWDGRKPNGNGTLLKMECRLDDEIPGLMALLTTRTHFYHYDFKRFCWREGVLLRDPHHTDTLALIEADGAKCIRIATTGGFASNLMERLAGSLEQLIHEMWPGGSAIEYKPYRFVIPCPTDGCPGYFLRDDLFHDLGDGDEEARCSEGRRCKHDIPTLLNGQPTPHGGQFGQLMRRFDGVDGRLDRIGGDIGDILSYVSNEAPRIYSLRPADKAWDPHRIISARVEIQIWCEELNRPVFGAVEVVALDKAWVKHLRAWAPLARKLVKLLPVAGKIAVAVGELSVSAEKDLEDLRDRTLKVFDAAEKAIGDGKGLANFSGVGVESGDPLGRHSVLSRGQYVEPEIAAVLQRAAKKGGMTRIQMDDDKRWRWVCREVADRNDRSVPKE